MIPIYPNNVSCSNSWWVCASLKTAFLDNNNNNNSGWIEFESGDSRSLPTFSTNNSSTNNSYSNNSYNSSQTYSGLPSASASNATASNLGFNYRVVVEGSNENMQMRVKQLVPDAFRTVINGRVVMQAGLFVEQGEAQKLQELLNRNGLPSKIMSVR